MTEGSLTLGGWWINNYNFVDYRVGENLIGWFLAKKFFLHSPIRIYHVFLLNSCPPLRFPVVEISSEYSSRLSRWICDGGTCTERVWLVHTIKWIPFFREMNPKHDFLTSVIFQIILAFSYGLLCTVKWKMVVGFARG